MYAGVERQDRLFSAWVLGHKCRSKTGVQTLGSVSVVLYSALWESAGVGGGEHRQIHSSDVHRFGVIRRSWISAELGLSVIQPTLESRPGLFWGCSGESLIIIFLMPVVFLMTCYSLYQFPGE